MIVDSDEIGLLTTSLRELLASAPADLDRALAELGWAEVVVADPATATTLLLTEHGRALATTAVLDSVVLPVLGVGDAVCYPAVESGSAPSSSADVVTGIVLRRPAAESRVVVPVATADGVRLALVAAADLELAPLDGIDPSLGWLTARGAAPAGLQPGAVWADGVVVAHRALAAEIIGVAEQALRLAIEHTSSRRQFGAPIAAFQAVRHRLADGAVALSAARALLHVAFDNDGASTAVAASAAKAQAGRAHDVISACALQVCGAIGATMEHPLHRYVARGYALDALLDSWPRLVVQLGELVQRTGDAPRLVEV
jgi:Acyl-CoA dehydrogenase, C-terminal domain